MKLIVEQLCYNVVNKGGNNVYYGNNMLYNNPYSYGNNGMMFNQSGNFAQNNQQNQGYGLTWVQGEVGAKGYQLPPNSTIILMDSENPHFYIKTTDNVGMASLRKFKFEEITNVVPDKQVCEQPCDYVTKAEFNEFKNKLLNVNKVNNEEEF